jgi:hypothetical protein
MTCPAESKEKMKREIEGDFQDGTSIKWPDK